MSGCATIKSEHQAKGVPFGLLNTVTDKNRRRYTELAVIIAFFAFILRLCAAVFYENDYDTAWNLQWASDLQNGFFNAYDGHVWRLDYPPLYLFVLKIVGLVTKSTAVSGFAPYRMLAIKLVPVLCDSLICFVLYLLSRWKSELLGIVLCTLWAINPAAIFNCGFWGQTDCVLLFLVLLMFFALLRGRDTLACIIYALCLLLKFQAAYLAPVVFLELIRSNGGFKKPYAWLHAVKNTVIAVGVWLAVWLPFMIGAKNILLPLEVYLNGANTYPYVNLNADNIYGIWGLNWHEEGIFAVLSTAVLFILCALLVYAYIRLPEMHILSAAFLFVNGVFMLTTRQHERYQMLALFLLLLVYARLRDRRILYAFCAQSVIVFANQARVLALVNHGGDWANGIGAMQTVNSLLNVVLFAYVTVVIMRYSIVPKPEVRNESD